MVKKCNNNKKIIIIIKLNLSGQYVSVSPSIIVGQSEKCSFDKNAFRVLLQLSDPNASILLRIGQGILFTSLLIQFCFQDSKKSFKQKSDRPYLSSHIQLLIEFVLAFFQTVEPWIPFTLLLSFIMLCIYSKYNMLLHRVHMITTNIYNNNTNLYL